MDELAQAIALLREVRRDWVVDTRTDGDQYGCCTVSSGEAMRNCGAKIDALLAKVPSA